VLVIGSGPTGLMAALAAGRAGARVILAEEDFRLGGRLLSETLTIGGKAAADWAESAVAELSSLPNVRLMPRTTVFGVYDGNTYGAVERVNDHVAAPPAFEPRQRGSHDPRGGDDRVPPALYARVLRGAGRQPPW
jgi:sarcosine oxidase subunit alpha